MYGAFPSEHAHALAPYVRGQRVVDVGCGDGERLLHLDSLRPAALLGLDPKVNPYAVHASLRHDMPARVTFWEATVERAARRLRAWKADLVHLAWPVNYNLGGLIDYLATVSHVALVVCNTDGTMCGTRTLYRYLLGRSVLVEASHPKNTLLVYGRPTGGPRILRFDEWACLSPVQVAEHEREAFYASERRLHEGTR